MRPGCYHSASKTHVRDRIFKLSPIHASVIYHILWIHRIQWIPVPFRVNSNSLHFICCHASGEMKHIWTEILFRLQEILVLTSYLIVTPRWIHSVILWIFYPDISSLHSDAHCLLGNKPNHSLRVWQVNRILSFSVMISLRKCNNLYWNDCYWHLFLRETLVFGNHVVKSLKQVICVCAGHISTAYSKLTCICKYKPYCRWEAVN